MKRPSNPKPKARPAVERPAPRGVVGPAAALSTRELQSEGFGIASTREQVKSLTDRQVTDLAQRCRQAAIEKKAEGVVLLDIRGRANFADYFVLATGRSIIQARSIADGVVEAVESHFGAPIRTEGYPEGSWVLVDYGPVIVHVFTPPAREFYNLERLWEKPSGRARRAEK
ncbi:MAG: ribosome silencing factor [Candidatus Eremiobacteraeota bacterium]|nr:ribosome silencing factor [Candidatus Eremiobacteraeota bacterium]